VGFFPCSLCGARFRGAAQHTYPASIRGGVAYSAHHRLCPSCFDASVEYVSARGIEVDATVQGTLPEGGSCVECGGVPNGNSVPLFLTAYPRNQERRDWYAVICLPCADQVAAKWSLL
jgi:hypothetical protein